MACVSPMLQRKSLQEQQLFRAWVVQGYPTIYFTYLEIEMPALSYPDKYTFYRIQGRDDLSILEVADEITELGRLVEKLKADEYENCFRAMSAIKFAEVIESILEEDEYESCVISRDSTDYFGNPRPYDIDFLIEPFYKKESINLCENPSMAMVVFRGSAQIEELLSGFQELANHAFFSEDNYELRGIINLLKSSLADRSEQCAIVVILRSYELHNS